jgi:hypothetical protein
LKMIYPMCDRRTILALAVASSSKKLWPINMKIGQKPL